MDKWEKHENTVDLTAFNDYNLHLISCFNNIPSKHWCAKLGHKTDGYIIHYAFGVTPNHALEKLSKKANINYG